MRIEHLDVLHAEFPELFQDRDLSPVWDDDLIIIPIDDPEWSGDNSLARTRIYEPFIELENWGANIEPQTDEPDVTRGEVLSLSPVIVDVLGGAHAGAPIPYVDWSKMPPSDCLAFLLAVSLLPSYMVGRVFVVRRRNVAGGRDRSSFWRVGTQN